MWMHLEKVQMFEQILQYVFQTPQLLKNVNILLVYQALHTLFHIEGTQIFQKGATSRPFETT